MRGHFLHRVRPGACELPQHEPRGFPAGTHPDACQEDGDCTEYPNGYCLKQGQAGLPLCAYACATDADCDANELCSCEGLVPTCVAASCREDADCGENLLCASYEAGLIVGCFTPPSFACQKAQDECASSTDCQGGICTILAGSSARTCQSPQGACGRPFLVNGAARLALVTARAGSGGSWRHTFDLRLEDYSAEERARLADHWAHAGALEHASIAAFARFGLQLLALGAPAHLLAETAEALADETEHARLCFGLSSAYAGCALEPEALDVEGALADTSLRSVLELTLLEGCLGESVAALEALEASRLARDPEVRAVLDRIAADETRHAALAFRFVAWAVARQPELRELALAAVQREAERAASTATEAPPPEGSGVLSAAERGQIRARDRRARRADAREPVGGGAVRRFRFWR